MSVFFISDPLIFVEITTCTPNTVSTAVIGIHFTFCFSDDRQEDDSDLLTPAFTSTTTPEKMKARTGNLGPEEALEAFQEDNAGLDISTRLLDQASV